ncbi:hypothetical protein NDN08_004565 [Rhodosorus marinus]|uniref:Uncharacterized protein n=1 Tax=Rhodosorus marinus TaxID=101924 RepID=A0AAV8UQU4_9RHOD|nr:hypothetical protein NDN08_004565 [Rhodosorus marinus]
MRLGFVTAGCQAGICGWKERVTSRRQRGWVCLMKDVKEEGEKLDREDSVSIEWKVLDEERHLYEILNSEGADNPLDRFDRWYAYEAENSKRKAQAQLLRDLEKESEEDLRDLKDSLRDLQSVTSYRFLKGENDDFTPLTYLLFTVIVGVPVLLAFGVYYELGQMISNHSLGFYGI